MDIGSILLIAALLLLVAMFVGRPFITQYQDSSESSGFEDTAAAAAVNELEHQTSVLLAERDQVLTALQELDFDNSLGKIPAEDYPEQRLRLVQHGADVLRQLDALTFEQAGSPASSDAEARLEEAISARRMDAASAGRGNGAGVVPAAVASPDDDLEIILANRRRARQDKAAGFCHNCGSPLQKSDRFCPSCGTKI